MQRLSALFSWHLHLLLWSDLSLKQQLVSSDTFEADSFAVDTFAAESIQPETLGITMLRRGVIGVSKIGFVN